MYMISTNINIFLDFLMNSAQPDSPQVMPDMKTTNIVIVCFVAEWPGNSGDRIEVDRN